MQNLNNYMENFLKKLQTFTRDILCSIKIFL